MAKKRVRKPIIFCIDDEVSVLNAVERDLRERYGKDYRIMKSRNGEDGLTTIEELKKRGENITLFVADQRMPGIEGTQFLEKAIKLYPDSKRILLTAYADTESAIDSINKIDLDHYLSKPWDPPEEEFYPVIDDLLSDWTANFHPIYDGIRVIGTLWSPQSHNIKDFLARNRIPYQFVNLEEDDSIQALLSKMGLSNTEIPLILFPDGENLVKPTIKELAEKVGLKTQATDEFYDVVIVGGGPAGLAAGVYSVSEGLRTLIIEKEATGGQAGTSSRIENYLGFPKGLSGSDLARRATIQAKRLGCEILVPQEVVDIKLDGHYKIIKMKDGHEVRCHALIIASGVSVHRFKVPGEDLLTGAGVYYGAAITEAAHYREKEVYVLGGGNSAGQGAMFFSRYASKVNIVIRRPDLTATMSQYLIEQIDSTDNIKIISNTTIEKLIGNQLLEKLVLKTNQEIKEVDANALFIFIGSAPRTEIVSDLIERDEKGYIMTGTDLLKQKRKPKTWDRERDPFIFETSIPGIFAAGDVRHDSSKRVAAAVGEGAITVMLIHHYLKEV